MRSVTDLGILHTVATVANLTPELYDRSVSGCMITRDISDLNLWITRTMIPISIVVWVASRIALFAVEAPSASAQWIIALTPLIVSLAAVLRARAKWLEAHAAHERALWMLERERIKGNQEHRDASKDHPINGAE